MVPTEILDLTCWELNARPAEKPARRKKAVVQNINAVLEKQTSEVAMCAQKRSTSEETALKCHTYQTCMHTCYHQRCLHLCYGRLDPRTDTRHTLICCLHRALTGIRLWESLANEKAYRTGTSHDQTISGMINGRI